MLADYQTISRTTTSTQFYVFNLFADYILPYSDGAAWTNQLLYLLDLLGVTDRAARTTLSRMKQKGWFRSEKIGRRSRYHLTEKGRAIIAEGDKRIFETPIENWDGEWHFAVYSLPEEKRALRNELRKKLTWFGFGRLAPGSWIGAHNRVSDLEMIVDEMEIRPFVSLFAGRRMGLISDEEIVAKCWDLEGLAKAYDGYIERWRPRLVDGDLRARNLTGIEERFKARFWLTYEFQPFPRLDPNLPTVLLPENWPGYIARRLFTYYRLKLNEGLPEFFSDLPGQNNNRRIARKSAAVF